MTFNTSGQNAELLLNAVALAVLDGHIQAKDSEGKEVLKKIREHMLSDDSSIARSNTMRLSDPYEFKAGDVLYEGARTELRGRHNKSASKIVGDEAPTMGGSFDEVPIEPQTVESDGPDTIIGNSPDDTQAIPPVRR